MIDFLKSWANQIIVSVIIATILEMILPDGNNKKYIKTIIGIYVMFNIIQPIILKAKGNNNFDFNIDNYITDSSVNIEKYNDFETDNTKLIEESYINNIKNDIISKIKQKGYNVNNINISIVGNKDSDKYGQISRLSLEISKLEDNNSNIVINTININKTKNVNTVANSDKNDIKEYIASEYSISVNIIDIK